MNRKSVSSKYGLKLAVVFLCLAGFIFQTVLFLRLYWAYPVVIDIQESIASVTDLPGISFCNSNALKPDMFCKMGGLCFPHYIVEFLGVCEILPEVCRSSTNLNPDFNMVTYNTFIKNHDLNATVMAMLKQDVKSFLTCKIIQGGKEIDCDMDDILIGSYYSDTSMFNLCYTMNSMWGNLKKIPKKIGKYDKIILDFFVDMTLRGRANYSDEERQPRYNVLTSSASIQLAVHTPYISLSPYASGLEFVGGKNYKVKLQMEEKHLLPAPYQTNCTDYMTGFFERGGIGPLNQLMVVEECKFNKTLAFYGCVPFSVDYPHNLSVCRYCNSCKELTEISDNCSALLDVYNQPCDSVSYKMLVEEATVFVEKILENKETGEIEKLVYPEKMFNCSFQNRFVQRCQETRIELLFHDFLVTNMTYRPKIENLELFSVIGGYMGVYLGVSFVTMYDIGEWAFSIFLYKKKEITKKKRRRANKVFVARSHYSTVRHRNTNYTFKDLPY